MVKRHSQSLSEMAAERGWTAAEKQVIEEARTGRVKLGSGALPDVASDRVEVRAGLIRHLVLGGCKYAPVPDKGVLIVGAWVVDTLDLEGCESPQDLRLVDCRLVQTPVLRDARLGGVYLPGCHVQGLNAHRLWVNRDVLLNRKFIATGPVDLSSARIAGSLACSDGRFDGAGGVALDGDAMAVAADVFLSDGFHATGQVNLRVARIGGQLACIGGRFDGAGGAALKGDGMEVGDVFLREGFHATGLVEVARAQISGNLQCQGGRFDGGLNAEGMSVGAGFFWERVAELVGPVDLTDAYVERLQDDAPSWQEAKPLFLSGFSYKRISGAFSLRDRLEWFERAYKPSLEYTKETGIRRSHMALRDTLSHLFIKGRISNFEPQLYTQLFRSLRDQGSTIQAFKVLEERGNKERRWSFESAILGLDGSLVSYLSAGQAIFSRPFERFLEFFFGYGFQPRRSFFLILPILTSSWLLYACVYHADQFAPNSDVVLTSEAWVSAVNAGCPATSDADYDAWRGQCAMPLEIWQKSEAAKDYETFSAGLYALDLFVPLDALGQESAWAPSKERGFWGALGYWMRMPVQMVGWIITAVGAAALTGLVGRKD